jgi:hypothetical protein
VQLGHFVCVLLRAGLMPLGTLGVVGGRLVFRSSFATFRRLCVLFLNFL